MKLLWLLYEVWAELEFIEKFSGKSPVRFRVMLPRVALLYRFATMGPSTLGDLLQVFSWATTRLIRLLVSEFPAESLALSLRL